MKKLFVILFLGILSITGVRAQGYLKTNSLYWLAGVPNASFEVAFAPKFSYNADVVFSPWKKYYKGKPLVAFQFINEARFYPKRVNQGFYMGAYAAFHAFELSKWNYANTHYQRGYGCSFGATLGYELPIAKQWLMDFYVGGGWQVSRYRGYKLPSGDMYVDWNASGEWIPYKIGVSFAYRLFDK